MLDNIHITSSSNGVSKEHLHSAQDVSSKYELRSDEVQEIMDQVPHWLLRRGIVLIFCICCMIFTAAFFIHFPDIVLSRVLITSANPPLKLIAHSSGRIQQLFVGDKDTVSAGQVICVIENTADYTEVRTIEKILTQIDTVTNYRAVFSSVDLLNLSNLGELQPYYVDLLQAFNNYRFFIRNKHSDSRIRQYQLQIGYADIMNKELLERESLLKKQLSLQEKTANRDSLLFKEKVIAPSEYEQKQKTFIDQQLGTGAVKLSIIQNKQEQSDYYNQIEALQEQKMKSESEYIQQIKDNVKRLLGEISAWEQKYILRSPIKGNVAFFSYWKENQYVNAGETLVAIVPPVQDYLAKANLSVFKAGKVEIGQKVLIKLSAYPFEEFGIIHGSVSSISPIAIDSSFMLEIKLDDGLKTASDKVIPMQPELSGIGEILTEDKTIMRRLFEKIYPQRYN